MGYKFSKPAKKSGAKKTGPKTREVSGMGDLRADPKNARKHGERNIGTIVTALKEIGAARSIVIDERNVVLAGNATVDAARQVGLTKVRVVDVDGDELVAVRRKGLTETEKARLALFDNRGAELAEWDAHVLAQLQADGVGLDGLFTDDELEALLPTSGPPGGLTEPDFVPEIRQTDIQRGDIVQMGRHRLMCGDSTAPDDVTRLLGGRKIDLVVTSPPYNVDIKYRSHKDRSDRDTYLNFIEATARAFVVHLGKGRYVAWNIGVSPKTFPAHQVVRLEATGLMFYRQIVWEKSGVSYPVFPTTLRTRRVRHYKPNYVHEVIQVFEAPELEGKVPQVPCALCDGSGKMAAREIPSAETHELVHLLIHSGEEELGASNKPDKRYANDVWKIAQSQATVGLKTLKLKSSGLTKGGKKSHTEKEHPAPFPVELPRVCAGFLTGPDEVVFDPFGGSGSTLIACEQMGRDAYLMEIDPVYCQIVVDRWEAFTGQRAKRAKPAA
jgi:DNA modification methylase